MLIININEAKAHLSRLVEDAAQGKSFVIAKAGKPMVKVTQLGEEDCSKFKRLGFMAGEISVPDDFDTMESDKLISLFNGKKL
ncbi:MAG: type II toxin-antitoxin system prevent-host-death family antitoxin [Desulfamplus sp.]|nr:type II toxin-antitoxin system prevent-host-death family antitoxin [Desulfamplus sp.]